MSGNDEDEDGTSSAAYEAAHRAGMPTEVVAETSAPAGAAVTRIVNIRHEECDVYIGRAGHGHDGYFGNPIRRGAPCPECGRTHVDNAATIRCYAVYFQRRIDADIEFSRRVRELRGLRLGCFCLPAPCHGQVIVRWLNNLDATA